MRGSTFQFHCRQRGLRKNSTEGKKAGRATGRGVLCDCMRSSVLWQGAHCVRGFCFPVACAMAASSRQDVQHAGAARDCPGCIRGGYPPRRLNPWWTLPECTFCRLTSRIEDGSLEEIRLQGLLRQAKAAFPEAWDMIAQEVTAPSVTKKPSSRGTKQLFKKPAAKQLPKKPAAKKN